MRQSPEDPCVGRPQPGGGSAEYARSFRKCEDDSSAIAPFSDTWRGCAPVRAICLSV